MQLLWSLVTNYCWRGGGAKCDLVEKVLSWGDTDSLVPSPNSWVVPAEVIVMYMLQLAMALCVESIILLDRLLYLKEQGIYNVCVLTQ